MKEIKIYFIENDMSYECILSVKDSFSLRNVDKLAIHGFNDEVTDIRNTKKYFYSSEVKEKLVEQLNIAHSEFNRLSENFNNLVDENNKIKKELAFFKEMDFLE